MVIPSSAMRWRRSPSKRKGLVTTPMVSAPLSRAISATIWAAPVPVPPPSPAVTKTMSESASALVSSSRDSSAASRPFWGSPPAPRPRVALEPMRILCAAVDCMSAWWSVFRAMNSTPFRFPRIIRLTALVPAPPTPTTRMRAWPSVVRSRSAIALSSRCRASLPPDRARKSWVIRRSSRSLSFIVLIPPWWSCRSEKLSKPAPEPRARRVSVLGLGWCLDAAPKIDVVVVVTVAETPCRRPTPGAGRPAEQPDHGRVIRPLDLVVHPAPPGGRGHPGGELGDALHHLAEAAQERPTAGEHDSAGEERRGARHLDLGGDQLSHLPGPRADDLGQVALGDVDRLVVPHRGEGHLGLGGQGA